MIYIDADGCPVIDIAVKLADKYGIDCIIICDTAHSIHRDGVKTITVEKGADSVDFKLVNLIKSGDIAITQDYGLAAMCLSKNAVVLNQDGRRYTHENISGLLEFRAVSRKIRNESGKLKGMSKRTKEQNKAFEKVLIQLLETI